MDAAEQAAIRQRADAATAGPWWAQEVGDDEVWELHCGLDTIGITSNEDASFMAHARFDVPALLDALSAAQDALQGAVARIRLLEDALGLPKAGRP